MDDTATRRVVAGFDAVVVVVVVVGAGITAHESDIEQGWIYLGS